MIYTGIGSRSTPADILKMMEAFAEFFAFADYTLRSGGAIGADTAFEDGAKSVLESKREIYLPSDGFNKHYRSEFNIVGAELEQFTTAKIMAAELHPNWGACTSFAKLLHTRNIFQILGRDLCQPADFVVCWTEGGKDIGGTSQALRLARKLGIPIYNLGSETQKSELLNVFKLS